MRLPMLEGAEKQVDIEQTKRMVDRFMEEGFNYFDTAHGYISKKKRACGEGVPHQPLPKGQLYPYG